VVASLGGVQAPVHLERVAVKAFEFLPGAFRWDLDEYATFIDKDKVRASLTDAEKVGHGQLVRSVGVTKQGVSKKTDLWRLTSAGSDWMVEHGDRIAELLGARMPELKKGRAKELRHRMVGSELYRQFAKHGEVRYSPYDFADLLECSPDASNQVVTDRFDSLQGQVRMLADEELEKFLTACAEAHRRMLEV
jgi:hypothetical protein